MSTPPPAIDPGESASEDQADVAAAVARAFFDAYTGTVSDEVRAAAVEDVPGVAEAGAEAAARYPEAARTITVRVYDVRVDGDRATVQYELFYEQAMPLGLLSGEAMLQDGRWKVTAETRCAVIANAGVQCPDLP